MRVTLIIYCRGAHIILERKGIMTQKISPANVAAFFTIIAGFFMVMLDATIVNITLPVMVNYFNTSMTTISWVVNGYNIAFAVLLLTASRIADQFGRKRLFIIGVLCFTVTSLFAGVSRSVELLIFFRVLQGMAGALLVPVSMPLIINLFPQSRRGLIIGIWGGVAGFAAASGPALGGIIGQYLTWQWIFYINIPIGLTVAALIPFLVKESYDPTAGKSIDMPGMVSLSVATFCVTLAFIQANDKGWHSTYILSLFAVSAVCFVIFYLLEKKSREPMLPMSLFSNPYFCTTNISLLIFGAAMMCSVFFTAFFLTQVKEFSQFKSGLVITAYPLVVMVCSAISGSLSDRFGNRIFAVTGAILTCMATWLMGDMNAGTSLFDIIWRLGFAGGALGLVFPTIVTASVNATPPEKIGIAAAVGTVWRTFGATLGVALLVASLTHFAEREIDRARIEATDVISASNVFTQEVKDSLVTRLKAPRTAEHTRLPSTADLTGIFEKRRDEAIKKAPAMIKPAVKKIYEKQIAEVTRLYVPVRKMFLGHIAAAFSITYRLSAMVLLVGIIFAFFCEPAGKKRRTKAVAPGQPPI